MTQPIGSHSSLNYTPYDPSLEQSQAAWGAGGASSAAPAGTEGAAGVPNVPSAPTEAPEPSLCAKELMKTVAACGSAYLSSRVPSPATPLAVLACAANTLDLIECLTADAPEKAP
jgi:hypothetical protein